MYFSQFFKNGTHTVFPVGDSIIYLFIYVFINLFIFIIFIVTYLINYYISSICSWSKICIFNCDRSSFNSNKLLLEILFFYDDNEPRKQVTYTVVA